MLGFGAFNPAVKRCGFVRGKKETGLICEQSVALENEGAVWTQLCRDMSHWPPPWSPRTLWSRRMALDYISGTATLYEVFLWNSLYCLTTSTWAQRLRGWKGGREVAPSRSEGVWYWWNMAGILKVFSLSSTHLSFKRLWSYRSVVIIVPYLPNRDNWSENMKKKEEEDILMNFNGHASLVHVFNLLLHHLVSRH